MAEATLGGPDIDNAASDYEGAFRVMPPRRATTGGTWTSHSLISREAEESARWTP